MHASSASLFEYAIYSSVEFCSISYNHPSLQVLYVHSRMRNTSFLQPQCLHLTQPRSSLSSISYILFPNAISCKKIQAHNGTPWRILPSIKSSPERIRIYIPPTPAPLCCKCPKYCLLVVFHAAMYFSMQFVKAVCSEDEMEEPGLGMARSKQCSLTLSTRKRAFCRAACWRTCCMTSVFASRAILGGI